MNIEDHTIHQNCPPYYVKGDIFHNASVWYWVYWNGGVIPTQDQKYRSSVLVDVLTRIGS